MSNEKLDQLILREFKSNGSSFQPPGYGADAMIMKVLDGGKLAFKRLRIARRLQALKKILKRVEARRRHCFFFFFFKVKKSALLGRGGAGSAGSQVELHASAQIEGAKYLVCQFGRGRTGTFKAETETSSVV